MTPELAAAVQHALANTRRYLLDRRDPAGHWVGALSSSALSTATGLFTLSLADRAFPPQHAGAIRAGLAWLAATQNPDGGWGDTVKNFSNISTTALVWAALGVPEADDVPAEVAARAEAWLSRAAGSLSASGLSRAIADRYGKDRTFSVPILTMLALAGRLGADPWRLVPQLPFELAACPPAWFQFLKLPVVSYALPALIAIGHARHANRPTRNPAARLARRLAHARTLRVLRDILPTMGGYLEATPLTSFVSMSLLGSGLTTSPVLELALPFLARSQRPDGSWPIDTDLATWVTTLAVNAGAAEGWPDAEREAVLSWLVKQQYRTVHPYTHAPPGGWAWTDLAGGVPDGDDTPGALLALAELGGDRPEVLESACAGVSWLLGLQNRDGGIPTFCRGWGTLPFDRSSNDLTAHALLAWSRWLPKLPDALAARVRRAATRAFAYLTRTQRDDGSWAPLWFGNQHADEVANLTHGTSRVLRLAVASLTPPSFATALARGYAWLAANQNPDGGWGGRAGTPSSVEETALALEALAGDAAHADAARRGTTWLLAATDGGTRFDPLPIGFYFANLWYYEELYPPLFVLAALTKLVGASS